MTCGGMAPRIAEARCPNRKASYELLEYLLVYANQATQPNCLTSIVSRDMRALLQDDLSQQKQQFQLDQRL